MKKILRATCILLFQATYSMTCQPVWSQKLNKHPELDQARLEYAKQVIQKFGDKIPTEVQTNMLNQKICLGMPPYEAYLAAGPMTFHVEADPSIWPANSDPYSVIAAQSLHPDNSKISLIFDNETQFPEQGKTSFTVYFEHGRAFSIIATSRR